MYRITIIAFILIHTSQVFGKKNIYYTQPVEQSPPLIDGRLDDPVWKTGEWASGFIQRQPHAGQPASEQTQFKILYDNNHLYVAIRCFDSDPDSIVRRMSRRDGQEGDLVKIVIDSYFNLRTGFSFGVTAAGVKIDEAISNSYYWDDSWDPVWEVKTHIDNQGWTAEASIPFSQLRFGQQENLVWGLEIQRELSRKGESSVWQYIAPDAAGYVNFMGELKGINDIQPRKQKELTPYLASGIKNYQPQPGNPFAPGTDYPRNMGLDGKFGITNDLTMDLTINPDFGQVEADPSEVNLSSYETHYREKRPFFVEGKDILSFRILEGGGSMSRDNLFYSRRIGRKPGYSPALNDGEYSKIPGTTSILGAVKLTGRTQNGWSIGFLESVTQQEYAEIHTEGKRHRETAEPLTNYLVSRLEKDLNDSKTQIGAMFTATNRNTNNKPIAEKMHREAYTAGIDFTHHWKDRTYYVNFNNAFSLIKANPMALLATQTSAPHFFQRPNTPHMQVDSTLSALSGYAGCFQIGRGGNGHWEYTFWVTWRSPEFNSNDLGYTLRNDEIQQIAWIKYSEHEPKGIFRNYSLEVSQWYGATFAGEHRYAGGYFGSRFTFTNYLESGFGISREGRSMSTEILRGGPALAAEGAWFAHPWLATDDRKKLKLTLWGDFSYRDQKTSKHRTGGIEIRYQINDALRISVDPRYGINENQAQRVSLPDSLQLERYVMGHMVQKTFSTVVRASYNISPDFTIEFYGMPFISAGKYDQFKAVNNAMAEDFDERFTTYNSQQIAYHTKDASYSVNEDLNDTQDLSFNDPNFNVFDFNSNLVLRWEFKPGSTAYLVWSQNRDETDNTGVFNFARDSQTLFNNTYPTDVLLFKFSYRFGL